jgi:hypothetical protein
MRKWGMVISRFYALILSASLCLFPTSSHRISLTAGGNSCTILGRPTASGF